MSRGPFAGLIDDAAVFPPGSSPLAQAISDHRRLLQSPVAEHLGPLLIPTAALTSLLDLIGDPTPPLAIGLIAAPGDTAGAMDALGAASRRTGLTVRVVEIAVAGRNIDELVRELRPVTDRSIGLAIEIPRNGSTDVAALAAYRDLIDADLLRGKYRTGGVEPGAVPSGAELAAVLVAAARNQVPLKFTAGLHHAVRTVEQHGVLNMMIAAWTAGQHQQRGTDQAATLAAVEHALETTDPKRLAATVTGWTPEQVAAVRRIFTGFGCCGVLEPLTEAAQLGVIPPLAHDITVTSARSADGHASASVDDHRTTKG